MKKTLLASLCMTALVLTACNKKPDEAPATPTENTAVTATTPATMQTPAANEMPATTTAMSSNNNADIKNDLDKLQTLSSSRAKEAIDLQNKATQAAEKGDKTTLHSTVAEMKTYIMNFNKELDDLMLNSSEADAIRNKIKHSNNLGLQLSEASIENTPDMKKITALQNEAAKVQKELISDMQALQNKVKNAA
ncbi:MAG: hypothetical protein PHW49_07735 [Acinetobacter harbinensis]|nr:hypothetical protein [Acinetobacter harbinensis]